MLDTNICIYVIKKKPAAVLRRLRRLQVSDLGISSITLSELEYGVSKSARRDQNKIALAEFLSPIEILSYDEHAAAMYGDLRAGLEARGRLIGSLDMLIAAHARALRCILVTNNEAEFSRVEGLKIQNWAKAAS